VNRELRPVNKELRGCLVAAVGVIIVIALVITMPLCSIWALNRLFGTSIQYGFFDWVAAAFLMSLFGANRVSCQKKG